MRPKPPLPRVKSAVPCPKSALARVKSAVRLPESPARAVRTSVSGERVQDLLAVLGELVLADTADPAEFGERRRRFGGDLPECRVVEDHIGRYALFLRCRGAPGPQALEHRRGLSRHFDPGLRGLRGLRG